MNTFLTQKRLLIYPRIIAVILVVIYGANILLRNGWKGRLGGYISFDFLSFYSAGQLYRDNIQKLYDIPAQFQLQQEIFGSTWLQGGGNISPYPPYVSAVTGLWTELPYHWAYFSWLALSIGFAVIAAFWLARSLVPPILKEQGLTTIQMLFLIFALFPLVFGLQLGQNHTLTLLIITGILVLTLKEKWLFAGLTAGLLCYKPQFVLGFLLIWLVWGKWKALLGFLGIAILWCLPVMIEYGLSPFRYYLNAMQLLSIELPLGVGRYLEMTPYALLATILPRIFLPTLVMVNRLTLGLGLLGLGWSAYRLRGNSCGGKELTLMMALLFPFIISPHVLIYDAVILAPFFLLWASISANRRVLYATLLTYLGTLLIPFISLPSGIAFLALIPIGLLAASLWDCLPRIQKAMAAPI
jgi:hypothetical protein